MWDLSHTYTHHTINQIEALQYHLRMWTKIVTTKTRRCIGPTNCQGLVHSAKDDIFNSRKIGTTPKEVDWYQVKK